MAMVRMLTSASATAPAVSDHGPRRNETVGLTCSSAPCRRLSAQALAAAMAASIASISSRPGIVPSSPGIEIPAAVLGRLVQKSQ